MQMIPSLTQHVLTKMTAGEKRLARRLEAKLEDDYLCWYDIPLGRKRRYPDFILLHPARGMLFLEVKDWKIDSLKRFNKTTVDLITSRGIVTKPNPLEQSRQYAYAALNLFEKDCLLQQKNGQFKGRLVFPYGWGVVLTNITRKQLNQAIPEDAQEYILPAHLVICKDEMLESVEAEAFQERLWGMFHYNFGKVLSKPQIDRIRWHLFPEIRINQQHQGQQDLLPLDNDDSDMLIPDIVKVMDMQQEQLARSLGEGHRVVHGVAGSGKTLILGFRALYLSEATSKPILILCFNISLAAKLRSFINEKGVGGQVQVFHFHDWCAELLKTYAIKVKPQAEKQYFECQVETVISNVDSGFIPREQYGAILIDEGHDFDESWLKLIPQMIDPETNSLLLLYDDAQSIYKRNSGLGFSLSSVGIQAQGRTSILKLNYRNTQEVLEFAYHFARSYISPHSADEDHIPLIEPNGVGNRGPEPAVRLFDKWEEERSFIVRCIRKWREKGTPLSDIAILYTEKRQGRDLENALKGLGIPCLWMVDKVHKQAYDPNNQCVSILTLHSSKGLEFPFVIVSGMPKNRVTGSLAESARLLYVGLTRAQNNLLVTSCEKEHDFIKKFQEVKPQCFSSSV